MKFGTYGENLTWTLDDNRTLTISGAGDMKNSVFFLKPQWLDYSRTIEKVVVECSITSIGNEVFYDCSLLKSITIPNSVTSIGDGAFHECISLTDITIPDSVTSIGKNAFWLCSRLKNIIISNSVISIGDNAFFGCKSLTSIIIPDSVISIGDSAFDACSGLTSITIPNSVTSIGEWTFFRCSNLKEIYYPAGRGFESKLRRGSKSRLIPYTKAQQSVIPQLAITQPVKKSTVPPVQVSSLPQTVSKPITQPVNENLRWKVEGKTLTVGGVREIENYSYSATPWRDSLRDIQKIIIEDGIEKISAHAFDDCTRLEVLTLPASVKDIGEFAFSFSFCGNPKVNGGKNVFWTLEDGILILKKNPAAKSDADFSTGAVSWVAAEENIHGFKLEQGVVPRENFFKWLAERKGDTQINFT